MSSQPVQRSKADLARDALYLLVQAIPDEVLLQWVNEDAYYQLGAIVGLHAPKPGSRLKDESPKLRVVGAGQAG